MRTTLVLEDQLAARAKHRAVDLGLTLSEFVNRALRAALDVETTRDPPPIYRVTAYGSDDRRHHEPGDFADALDEDDATAIGKQP